MSLSVALTRVVPRIISLLSEEGADSRQLEPSELAMWERIYGTLAVADREASVILHTILQSVHPINQTKAHHEPSLALMQPLSPEKTRETLDVLTPEMHAMVVEANIKNHTSGPIQTAWRSTLATTSKHVPADSIIDQTTCTTVEEDLPRTPNSLWDEIQREEETEQLALRIGSPSRSRSGSPTLRREALSTMQGEDANQTKTSSPGRNTSGPSPAEF
jgi:hypothetical protein